MANQLNALSVPDVGDECVAPGEPPIEFLGSENSVVYFAAESLLGLADFGCELRLVRPAKDQNVNIAGGIGFVFCERAVEPSGLDAGKCLERVHESWLDADGTLKHGEYGLQIGVVGIDVVVALATLRLRAQEALPLKAGELAGCVGGIGANCCGQLTDIDARGTVDVEERQQIAAEGGAEGDHCSIIILHLQ
jgi:hypothetical protein